MKKKITLSIFSFLIILFLFTTIFEIFLRTEYSQIHVFGPYGDLPERLVPTINSQGFRDVEHTFEKPDSITRILFLGDSFTFGHGVADEEVYTKIIDELAGPSFEIINLSKPGWNTQDQLDVLTNWPGWNYINFLYYNDSLWEKSNEDLLVNYYKWNKSHTSSTVDLLRDRYKKSNPKRIYDFQNKFDLLLNNKNKFTEFKNYLIKSIETKPLGLSYNPDIVVFGFVLNDVLPKEERSFQNLNFNIGLNLDIERFISFRMRQFRIRNNYIPSHYNKVKKFYNPENKNWINYEKILKELSETLKTNNIIGIAVPLVTSTTKEELAMYNIILNKFEKYGFRTIDLAPSFDERFSAIPWSELKALPNDGHPGPIVHNFYAQEIWKELKPIIDSTKSSKYRL